MSISDTRLAYLFNRYYEKTASREETAELMQILYESGDDEQLTTFIRQVWENLREDDPVFPPRRSEEILSKILQTGPSGEKEAEHTFLSIVHYWKKLAAAAAVLLVAGAGIYFWQSRTAAEPAVQVNQLQNDILPGGNKAVLTLGDGSTIVLDSLMNGRVATEGFTSIDKIAGGGLEYRASGQAASGRQHITYNRLSTPKGGQYKVTLPDGSKVWLNAASSIRYPTAFSDTERKVELRGEAFFEVSPNEQAPFKVISDGMEVEVLGTTFNVMAYRDEAAVRTTLLEGSVMIIPDERKGFPAADRRGNKKRLAPGQQARLNRATFRLDIADVNTGAAVAWKNGVFQFENASIKDVMRQAARWYDIEVTYDGKVPERQFTGKVPRNVPVSELLDMLRYTGVNFRIEGRRIIVTD